MSPQSDNRTRVLILVKGLGVGGAETLIADAATVWDHSSFHYRVAFMLPWKDQLQQRVESAGVEVVNLGWHGLQSVRAIRRLRSLCAEFNPQIVHSHLPAAGVLARLVCRDTVHVYTEHNIVDHYREPTRTLNRVTYSRNMSVITVSGAVAASVAGYPGPEPVVIENGIDVRIPQSDIDAARAELAADDDTRLVVHVGNIRPLKGHSNLISATELLVTSNPDILVVSIGGEKHAGDLKRLQSEVEKRGLGTHLRFLGRRSDARPFLAAADCVVNPSDVEGMPVVLLEALALERPVVATDVGGVSTVIRHEVTGLLVPPGDPESLAAAIARCLASPDAESWGREGKRLVDDEHGLRGMVEGYEDVYRRLFDG